jgi:Pectate lyase superfamily protein
MKMNGPMPWWLMLAALTLCSYARGQQHAGAGPEGGTLQAKTYGAVCNGATDDTDAINKAVSAAVVIAGGAAIPNPPLVPVTVELPAGLCLIHAPIVVNSFGSLMGSANGTWIQAVEPWTGTDYTMVEMRTPFAGVPGGNGTATINRYVKDINFRYTSNQHSFTGIKVFDQAGSSPSMPYPAGVGPYRYQVPGIRIEGNTFYTMDTAIDLEDCGECFIENNQILFVRIGIIDGGNNFSVDIDNDAIKQGSNSFTSIKSGPTIGIQSYAETRWICVGGSGPACSGGRIEKKEIVSPQGLNVTNTIVSTFDMDADIINLQGGGFHDDGFDYGGNGVQPDVANPTIRLGLINWFQIDHCLVANSQAGAHPIEIAAPTFAATDSSNFDGLWITDNYIQGYVATSNGAGIYFLPGTYSHRNIYIVDNQFAKLGYGVMVKHPLTQSVIRGNYGSSINHALLLFDAAGSNSYKGTVVDENTTPDSVPVVTVPSGGGLVEQFNQSASQLTGMQIGSAKGCTFSAGAAGNYCSTTVTLPLAYPDTTYTVSCAVQNGSGRNTVGSAVAETGQTVKVNEVALSPQDTGGGEIVCTANHY